MNSNRSSMQRRDSKRRAAAFLRGTLLTILAVLAAACVDDDVAEPIFVPEGGELFIRYVSLGNSITAGFQSAGINADLQDDAYPVLLAEKAGATFGIPSLSLPGCPPPLVAPLSSERLGGGTGSTCAYRALNRPTVVQNVAVPGHTMLDAVDPLGPGANPLATLINGGRTQVEAMLAAEPTLVSVWLGNNDALAAALSGDTTRLTPLPIFQAALDQVVGAIEFTPAEDAIFIGVVDPIMAAPALQPGAYFWAVAQSGAAPVPLAVQDNCAPGTAGGSRWVSFLVANAYVAGATDSVRVDCGPDAAYVLTAEEVTAVSARIQAFNAAISEAAEAHEWAYVDPTTSFTGPALADPDLLRKCQGLATATTGPEIQAAVEETCPGPGAPNFFGAYLSFDGIHPSAAAHEVIADTLAQRLNARHGLSLPTDG